MVEHFFPFVGGVSTVFEELGKQLVARGHEVTVVTVRLPGTPAREVWQGMTVERVNTPPFSRRYWFTIAALPTLWRLARTSDIIHTTTYNAALPAWLVARLQRKPVVITVHEVWGKRWLTYPLARPVAWLYQLIERLIVALPYTAMVTVSDATARDLRALRSRPSLRLETIYNGVDQQLFRRLSRESSLRRDQLSLPPGYQLLYYGRPGVSKGVEILIKAFTILKKKNQLADIRLFLLLNQDPHDRYQAVIKQIQANQLESIITVHDPVDKNQLPNYLRAASCVVIPSLAEGFGLSAVEACTIGRPLIATTAGSLPEVVFGQVILCPPGQPRALAQAILAARAGQFKLIPAKNFTWQRTAQDYERLYRELL